MPASATLTKDQRGVLLQRLQSRLGDMQSDSAARLHQQTQVDAARQTLLQDADDATQQDGAHEVEGSVATLDSAEFQALRDALQRIHRADYGLCIDCQVDIPYERLLIEPQALRCTDCQVLHERSADRFQERINERNAQP